SVDRRMPRRCFERARGDVLRHAVHLLAELARALHGRPGGCKALVREASQQQGVAGEELSRFELGGLFGPKRKRPHAGFVDVAVEGDVRAGDYLSWHLVAPLGWCRTARLSGVLCQSSSGARTSARGG